MSDFYGCGGLENFAGYCQRLLTSQLNQSSLILDERRRAAALKRADKLLAEDVPVIPLFNLPAMAAVRTTVDRFVSDFSFRRSDVERGELVARPLTASSARADHA